MKRNVRWTYPTDDSVNDVDCGNVLRLVCGKNIFSQKKKNCENDNELMTIGNDSRNIKCFQMYRVPVQHVL